MIRDKYVKIYQKAINYIQGSIEGDTKKLSKVLHKDVVKKFLQGNCVDTYDYNQIVNNGNKIHKDISYNTEINILNISDTAASLMIKSDLIELIQMMKIDKGWFIVNILGHFNSNRKKRTSIINYKYKLETEHFIINYYEPEIKCIGVIISLLEKNYVLITKRFRQKLQQKTIVDICSNKSQLHSSLNIKDGPDWIRGGISSGKTIIASPINPPPGSDFYNVVNTVIHEFVHVLIKEINEKIPRWLNEGIASYEGKDNNESWILNTVKEGLKYNSIPLLKDLDTGDDFELFYKIDGYQYSYSIIEFIVKNFGYVKLIQLIKNPDDLNGIFNMTEKEFYSEWVDYLKINY